jgi:hypothetical protein
MAINDDKLNELIGQFVTDFGAAMHAATVVIGDKLGLYKALAEHGPITGAELARRRGLDPRLVEEWLNAQFVSGYSDYDPSTGEFHLTEEQAAVLADDSTPASDDHRRGDLQGRGPHPRGVRVRQGPRLARALPRLVPRH